MPDILDQLREYLLSIRGRLLKGVLISLIVIIGIILMKSIFIKIPRRSNKISDGGLTENEIKYIFEGRET